MIPFDDINRAALAAYPGLLHEWFPAGKRQGGEFVLGDLQGNPGRSLSINVHTGAWGDFSSDLRGGDPISLCAAAFHRGDRVAAARALGKKMGVQVNGVAPEHPAGATHAPDAELWQSSVPPESAPIAPTDGWDHVYAYRDANGTPLRYVLRRDAMGGGRKSIVPLTWGTLNGEIGWHRKQATTPRCLYGLDRLAKQPDAPAIICEGEKAADAAQAMFPRAACITWTAGTGNVARNDWSPLQGRRVIVWPDNDEPGAKAARELVEALHGVAAKLSVLRVDDLPPKADAADIRLENPTGWLRDRLSAHEEPPLAEPPASESDQPPSRRAARLDAVKVRAGDVDLAADAGEAALSAAGLPVFQRGPTLVRPGMREVGASNGRTTVSASLSEIGSFGLIDMLAQAVEWNRYDRRSGEWRTCDPPANVAGVILSRAGRWSFPSIGGVITTPTLRPDGSVLSAEGYDPATRLFYVRDPGLIVPDLDAAPTRKAALKALAELDGLLAEFPFEKPVDRSVALSALITPVVRGALSTAPLHAFRASAPGSGKSYLADLASALATGRLCPALSASSDEGETEKRLNGLLLSSYPLISLDNVNGELGGDLLCQAVERPLVQVRELGRSTIFEIENRATIYANGNGLRVRGDMVRRTLLCSLDAAVERPELRVFESDPVAEVLSNRGHYVAAALMVVRAYLAAGRPAEVAPLASFEDWSGMVRGALVWLCREDPCITMEAARTDDPELSELKALLMLWADDVGIGQEITIRELIERAKRQKLSDAGYDDGLAAPDLLDALMRISSVRGVFNPKSFGNWLKDRKGRLAGGLRVVQRRLDRKGIALWMVERVG